MNTKKHINKIFTVFYDAFTINASWIDKQTKKMFHYVSPTDYEIRHFNDYLNNSINKNIPIDFISIDVMENDLQGTIVVGPFCYENISPDKIKRLIILEGYSLHKFDEILNYYQAISVIHPSKMDSIKTLVHALVKLPESLDVQDTSKHDEEELIDYEFHHTQWKQHVNPYHIGKIETFFNALFDAKDDEVYQVLNNYYFITQPFEIISTDNENNVKHLAFIMLGMTVSFALLRQVSPLDILEKTRVYYDKLSLATTDQEVIDVRNQMFISFNRLTQRTLKKKHSPPVNRIIKYIDDHIFESISIIDIAAIDGYEKNYVSTLFKKETGSTIHQYVKEKKIDIAKSILKKSNTSIHDLSEYLSFTSYQQFNRTFKRIVGSSPSEYRSSSGE